MKKIVIAGITGLLGGLLMAGSLRGAEEKPKPTGDVEVTVAIEGGKTLKECKVYLGDRTVVLDKDLKSIVISQVEARKRAVTAEASASQGWFRRDSRYIGVTVADVRPGKVTQVAVALTPLDPNVPGKSINDFCLSCHPNPGEPTEPGQIPRDIHKTGIILKDKVLGQVKKYNARLETLEKEGKPHGLPILLEEREVTAGGKQVKRSFSTCYSCHTPHAQTVYGKYVVASFLERSDLCLGCHS